jgi:hypothetical protein
MLLTMEHAPTLSPFIIFTFGFIFYSIEELWGSPCYLMCIGMVSLTISLSSKRWHISQQDSNIVMTCMHCHDTSPPPHPMIPNTWPQLVFLVTFSSSTYFTPSLPY